MYGVIMKITWLLAVIANRLFLSQAQLVSEDDCATGVHAIIARGQGGGDDLNVMKTLSDLILQQIPGSTTLGLPYDHENVLTDAAKRDTVHDAAVLMQEFVQEYAEACPDVKIVVVGYSMGAVAMMDAICGTSEVGFIFVPPLQPSYSKTIIAAIAYGDETYNPGMPWNVGNCTLGIGVTPRMNSALCSPFGASIHSYCDYGDNQCCSPYPADGNVAHHGYVKKYNQDVVDFIKQRLVTA
ncbi:hypothetical protein N7452_004747 [Penicillium brevicompactum]|uniref:Cutinase n=1 Tax=Penicillium brevicompactum TaxID=5074 RepID=A0A9W9QJS4_PENBR|nr:hypothetical protein N7452_004747 [Penicillium brevicompactum]